MQCISCGLGPTADSWMLRRAAEPGAADVSCRKVMGAGAADSRADEGADAHHSSWL